MIFRLSPLALGALILSAAPFTNAIAPSDIPTDIPVSQLIATANAKLAAGEAHDALTYFDVAVARDPKNYLTIFKRGATYLSLGRNSQAEQDFNRVLTIKPGFEGALLQRAKIKSRRGDWNASRKDYELAGRGSGEEVERLNEAEGAATLAQDAAGKSDWEGCVSHAGTAILVAGTDLDLRKLRARCRLEKGEVMEGLSDLQHVLQISSGSIEPHLQISAMSFYSLGETDKGLQQIRKCLQSDPDSKACMKLMKREKNINKSLNKVREAMEKRRFTSAVQLLIPRGEDAGLIQEVKEDIVEYKKQGYIAQGAPDGLYQHLVETTCEAYMEMNNRKRAKQYCTEVLQWNPTYLQAALCQAEDQLDAEDWEAAIRTLNEAKDHHQGNNKLHQLLNKAQLELKKSKQKDYYKVLGISRDASDRDIKKAWRSLSKQYHPDKAGVQGIDKEEAEKKMAAINEAYEVLSDPELKARFDNGDDPNNPEQGGNPFQGSPFGGNGQQFFFRQGGGGNPFGGQQFKFSQQGGGGFQFPGGFGFP